MARSTSKPSTPAVKPKTLTQQNNDFTSEGSPPPGHVGTALEPNQAAPKRRAHAAKQASPAAPRR